MKTANELMKTCIARDDWKHLRLWRWASDYESKMLEWNNILPPVDDDRRVYINIYKQVYDAIDSLPDNPNPWVCCAVSHEMDKEREVMNEIIARFGNGC